MKEIFTIFVIGIGFQVFAQDIHFSQTAETPLLINPASTGVYSGWERMQINQRNQWLGANTQFSTSSLAFDVNFFKTQRNDQAHLGLGMFFYNDIGGDSKFGTQSGALSLSGILPVGGGHTLSAGLQAGFANRSADLSRVFFESQINGNVFDPAFASGENANVSSFKYADISSGLYYQYDSEQSTFRRNNRMKFELGGAVYHVNQPTFKYLGIPFDRLYSKFVFHTAYSQDIQGTNWAFDASAVQFIQGPHLETLLGGMGRYRFSTGSKITGFSRDAYFGVGMYMRIKDAIIPRVTVDWKGMKFGLSYDFTVSKLRKAYKGGSLEFSISYTNMQYALLKRRGR
jgi:type IX secretion system PorP/SprF family membrane protein